MEVINRVTGHINQVTFDINIRDCECMYGHPSDQTYKHIHCPFLFSLTVHTCTCQCGKALPGLTKQDQCCGTIGTSWGFHKCQKCPKEACKYECFFSHGDHFWCLGTSSCLKTFCVIVCVCLCFYTDHLLSVTVHVFVYGLHRVSRFKMPVRFNIINSINITLLSHLMVIKMTINCC